MSEYLPAPNETIFHTGSLNLRVLEGPRSGPPLVLLHGGTGEWLAWRGVIDRLAGHWHIYAVNLRGHGRSDWAGSPDDYHLSAFRDDVLAFLSSQVNEPLVLWGHSWGALTSMLCAQAICAHPASPTRLRGVVLEDPGLGLERGAQVTNAFLKYFGMVREQLLKDSSIPALAAFIQAARPGMPDQAAIQWAETKARVDPVFIEALLTGNCWTGLSFTQALREITCPVLLLQADQAAGGAMEPQDAELVCQNVRDLELVYFQGCGHGLSETHPEATAPLVDRKFGQG